MKPGKPRELAELRSLKGGAENNGHKISGRENAGHEIDGHEIARHIVRIVWSVTVHGFSVLNEKHSCQPTQHLVMGHGINTIQHVCSTL